MLNRPWLPYLATDFIERLNPRSVFEWGSGGSTLFFVSLGAFVVSVEHDKEWFSDVQHELWKRDHWNVTYLHIPFEQGEIGPDKSNPAHYKSGSTLYGLVNFKAYAGAIDAYEGFDLILIDGMARASCIQHAFSHVKPGGCLVVDNTGDRPYYLEKTAHLFGNWEAGWERVDILGHGPGLDYKWQTTFFLNRDKGDYE